MKKWPSQSPPGLNANPMAAVVTFARYMGMASIPRKTVEKLRTDRYFRYCFYQLRLSSLVYDQTSPIGKAARENLARILRDSDSVTPEDQFHGLNLYLNNFVGYMPGGFRRKYLQEMPKIFNKLKNTFDTIDRILEEKKMLEKAIAFRAEIEDEEGAYPDRKPSYAKRVEYLKLCLDIFNILVKWGKFDPEELWK